MCVPPQRKQVMVPGGAILVLDSFFPQLFAHFIHFGGPSWYLFGFTRVHTSSEAAFHWHPMSSRNIFFSSVRHSLWFCNSVRMTLWIASSLKMFEMGAIFYRTDQVITDLNVHFDCVFAIQMAAITNNGSNREIHLWTVNSLFGRSVVNIMTI